MVIVCKCSNKKDDRDAAKRVVDRSAQGKKGYSMKEEKEDDDEEVSSEEDDDDFDYGIKGREEINN